MLADARPLSALNYSYTRPHLSLHLTAAARTAALRRVLQINCICRQWQAQQWFIAVQQALLSNRATKSDAFIATEHRTTKRDASIATREPGTAAARRSVATDHLAASQNRAARRGVCELQDDGPDFDTNAAADATRAGLNTPAADALVSRGIDAEADGETLEALEAYEGAVELDPNHPNALFRLGALNVQFGLTEDARDLFHRAFDADPDHSAAAACLHLLQDVDATELDAQHAASIEAARAEDDAVEEEVELVPVEVARRTAVKRIPRFLSDAEIDELTATAALVEADVGPWHDRRAAAAGARSTSTRNSDGGCRG